MKGWDAEDAARVRAERTPEQEREHAEAVAWLDVEMERWMVEMGMRSSRHKTQDGKTQERSHNAARAAEPVHAVGCQMAFEM